MQSRKRFNIIPIKIPVGYFAKTDKLILKAKCVGKRIKILKISIIWKSRKSPPFKAGATLGQPGPSACIIPGLWRQERFEAGRAGLLSQDATAISGHTILCAL